MHIRVHATIFCGMYENKTFYPWFGDFDADFVKAGFKSINMFNNSNPNIPKHVAYIVGVYEVFLVC